MLALEPAVQHGLLDREPLKQRLLSPSAKQQLRVISIASLIAGTAQRFLGNGSLGEVN
jgi:hypothetical protein